MHLIRSKSVTLADVAREAGISKATASLALKGDPRTAARTRQAVLQAARKLRYEPNLLAQNWSKGRSYSTIGLFAPGLDLGVRTEKLQTIQGLLSERGFDVPVYVYGIPIRPKRSDQAALMSTVRRQKPRAVICNAANDLQPETLRELVRYREEGGLLLSYDDPLALDCDQVLFDREDNTYQAARHLLELGHRRMAFCLHGYNALQHPRLAGFRRALGEFGLETREDWIFSEIGYEAAGAKLAARFLDLADRPTGICIVNDLAAATFVNEVQRAGLRVPEDVSVVGHDDTPAARYCAVPLTTVSHPATEIAHAVVDLLTTRLEGSSEPETQRIVLQGALVRRASAAPPQAL